MNLLKLPWKKLCSLECLIQQPSIICHQLSTETSLVWKRNAQVTLSKRLLTLIAKTLATIRRYKTTSVTICTSKMWWNKKLKRSSQISLSSENKGLTRMTLTQRKHHGKNSKDDQKFPERWRTLWKQALLTMHIFSIGWWMLITQQTHSEANIPRKFLKRYCRVGFLIKKLKKQKKSSRLCSRPDKCCLKAKMMWSGSNVSCRKMDLKIQRIASKKA